MGGYHDKECQLVPVGVIHLFPQPFQVPHTFLHSLAASEFHLRCRSSAFEMHDRISLKTV